LIDSWALLAILRKDTEEDSKMKYQRTGWLITLFILTLGMTVNTALAQNKTLTIRNHTSGYFITYVYITPAGQNTWGPDQLEQIDQFGIAPGGSGAWSIPWRGCRVDMKVISFLGVSAERLNTNICGGFVWELYDKK